MNRGIFKTNTENVHRDLLKKCRELYRREGIGAFSFKSLLKQKRLYVRLYKRGITQKELLRLLGLEQEYADYKKRNWSRRVGDTIQRGWTWDRVITEAKAIVKREGFLPPAEWFQKNDAASLVQAVYNLDHTWGDLREACDSFANSDFVVSRSGQRWRSHPEASLSNFLYARGIKHEVGIKYPEDYSGKSGYCYGYYDLRFCSNTGDLIDVEIWGDKPKGHQQEEYAKKRKTKEHYNIDNPHYLGIEYYECYEESRLEDILRQYIGIIIPFVFDKPTDKAIPSTHWSNADELLDYCQQIASEQSDGKFPTEEWLRKRGKWKDREGIAYNTLSKYIGIWIGGVRHLRQILGQPENSTIKWTREIALQEYAEWYRKYGMSPGAVVSRVRRGQMKMDPEEYHRGTNIRHGIEKYVGGTEDVHKILGLPPARKARMKKLPV